MLKSSEIGFRDPMTNFPKIEEDVQHQAIHGRVLKTFAPEGYTTRFLRY